MADQWKPVLGWKGFYAVSQDGKLMSILTKAGRSYNRTLSPWDNGNTYLAYRFIRNGRREKRYMHRVVWEAFNGPIPEKYDINHKNGVKSDNRLENLELTTRTQNMRHYVDVLGRGPHDAAKGSSHGCAKLTEADIPVIRDLLKAGVTQGEIGRRFGVSKTPIGFIARGKNWKHVPL